MILTEIQCSNPKHKRKLSEERLNICHLNARRLKNNRVEVKFRALEYGVDIKGQN